MNVTRRSFLKLASLVGLGFIVRPPSDGPSTIMGFPIKWVRPDEPKSLPTILPMSSGEAEALAAQEQAWRDAQPTCSRCGGKARFLVAKMPDCGCCFGTVIYRCPKCDWTILVPGKRPPAWWVI